MALETATYIDGLVATNPTATDDVSQGDNHIQLLKSTIKATFPNVAGAVTPTHTELNYVDGVTSAIQTQINATWVKLLVQSPTGDAAVDFVHGTSGVVIDSTYDEYCFVLNKVTLQTDGARLSLRYSTNGGSSYDEKPANYILQTVVATGTSITTASDTSGSFLIAGAVGNVADAEDGICGEVTIYSPSAATRFRIKGQTAHLNASAADTFQIFTGYTDTDENADAFRFAASSGNITGGTISLYARKK